MKVIILCLAVFAGYAHAEQACSVSQFSFMVGNWSGTGWYLNTDGSKSTFQSTEAIAPNLNGKILQMEGFQTVNGRVVNHALTTIAFDSSIQKCIFDVFIDPGVSVQDPNQLYHGNYPVAPTGKGFSWMQGPRRYTMTVNAQGQWYEIGEISPDGKTWTIFFTQTLDKQ